MLLITPEDFKKLSPEQKDEYMKIYKLVNSFGNQLSPRGENSQATRTKPDNLRDPIVFKPKPITEGTNNLIIGSSILARIPTNDLPNDIALHTYRGSMTDEKLECMQKYESKQLKSVTLQNGTNSVPRQLHLSVGEIFETYCKLIDTLTEKFSPEVIFLCQIPPLKSGKNSIEAGRIKEFNDKIAKHVTKNKRKLQLITLYDRIVNIPAYKNLYYDEVHLKDPEGCIVLKNCLMEKMSPFSNLVPRNMNKTSRGPVHPIRGRGRFNFVNNVQSRGFANNVYNARHQPYNDQTFFYTRGQTGANNSNVIKTRYRADNFH